MDVALRPDPNRPMRTGYVPECTLRGADPGSSCSNVLSTGLGSLESKIKRYTSRLMAEVTETNRKDDASDAVDEKSDEALENAVLGVGAQDGPVAAGERAHLC